MKNFYTLEKEISTYKVDDLPRTLKRNKRICRQTNCAHGGCLVGAYAGWYEMRVFKLVDTCAAEFKAKHLYYSTFEAEIEKTDRYVMLTMKVSDKKIIVLGSGPNKWTRN
jgi:carbamoyl-phosphate synthase large subunit